MLRATGLSQLNHSSGGTSDISWFKFPVKMKGSTCTLSSPFILTLKLIGVFKILGSIFTWHQPAQL